MKLQKKDFISIEFTGRIKDGEVFDSNIKEDLKKANLNIEVKPFVFCLGEGMFLKGIEDFLIGKKIEKKYEIELKPENAFGNRDSRLVQLMPMKIFVQQKINPVPGAVFNFDGRIAKILSVSGGRVIVDFNNPLAGKTVMYKLKVLKKLDDLNEKIKALNEFLFKKDFKFEIRQEAKPLASSSKRQTKDKKLIMHVDKPMAKFVELFKDKFKEIFGLELVVKEIEKKKEEKKEGGKR